MNYLDIDFPKELSYCFAGGAEFCTSLAIAKNKQEVRNDNWQYPCFKYNLLYKYCNNVLYNKLQSFFLICRGQKYSFNFLDMCFETMFDIKDLIINYFQFTRK